MTESADVFLWVQFRSHETASSECYHHPLLKAVSEGCILLLDTKAEKY